MVKNSISSGILVLLVLVVVLVSSCTSSATQTPWVSVPDPCSGFVPNGCFDSGLDRWQTDQWNMCTPVARYLDGSECVLLGCEVPQEAQHVGYSLIRQYVYLPKDLEEPLLSFSYRVCTNTGVGWSMFEVALQDFTEKSAAEIILQAGYQGDGVPSAGTCLEWASYVVDIQRYRGHILMIEFAARNVWESIGDDDREIGQGFGIWVTVGNIVIQSAANIVSVTP